MNLTEAETIGSRSRIAVAGGVLILAGAAGFLAAGSPLNAPFRLLVAAPETIAGHVDALRGPVHLAAGAALLVAIGGLLVWSRSWFSGVRPGAAGSPASPGNPRMTFASGGCPI